MADQQSTQTGRAAVSGPRLMVRARLSGALAELVAAELAAGGRTEAELIRAGLLAVLQPTGDASGPAKADESEDGGAASAEADVGEAEGEVEEGGKARLTVRYASGLTGELTKRARAAGMRPARWVSSLLTSNLRSEPVLLDREIQAVEAIARELAAIGRNLNQVARALNQAHFESERVKLEEVDKLSALVKASRARILALVRASRNYWSA